MKKVVLFLVALCLAFTVSCKKKPEGEAIKIGVLGPMQFTQGKSQWNGAVLAAEEINDNGGVKVGDIHRPIEVIKYDTNEFFSITDATNTMQRAINKDNVDFLIGGFRTEAVLAMQDIAMDSKKIFLGCGAADDKLCARVKENYNRYKYWFRMTPFRSSMLGKTFFMELGIVAKTVAATLKIKPKVAIVAEKQAWVEPIVNAAKHVIPNVMKMELVGVWQPSQAATDVSGEISAVQRAGANIIFTVLSGPVGITFVKQASELKVPAVMCGVNVEATKSSFAELTDGKGYWVATTGTYIENASYNDRTQPFVKAYIKKFGEAPTYTSDTYVAVMSLAEDIEAVGSLDADSIVARREKTAYTQPAGVTKYDNTHDLVFGPGLATGLFCQWQDGKLVAFWPHNWVAAEGMKPYSLEGAVPYKVPPYMLEAYRNK